MAISGWGENVYPTLFLFLWKVNKFVRYLMKKKKKSSVNE